MPNEHLESRIAQTEARMDALTGTVEILTKDVRDLAVSVRQHGESIDGQIRSLLVAVTSASGPRKTDWHLVLGAGGLILAIGAAALTPIMMQLQNCEKAGERTLAALEKHVALPLHPVGQSRIDALELALRERAQANADGIKALDVKLQTEAGLLTETLRQRLQEVTKQFENVRQNGSPITRERLAVIEEKLKQVP